MESTLNRQAMEAVIRAEITQRVKDEMEGEAEEAPSIIREYQARILLACADRKLAERYFDLLKKTCYRYDFLLVYEAGQESARKGESLRDGFYRYMREFAINPENQKFDDELMNVFTRLSQQMPNEEATLYPWYLLEEYRKTYGAVNYKVDEFFKMGYDAVANERNGERHERDGENKDIF